MKGLLSSAVFVAILTAVITPVRGIDPDSLDIQVLRRGQIAVQGSLGNMGSLTFMIDTGASVTTVDQGTVSKLNLESRLTQAASLFEAGGQFPEVVLKNVSLGPVSIGEIQAIVMDFSSLDLGKRVDLIIGLDILRTLDFTIDYRARKIRFGTQEPLEHQAHLIGIAPLLLAELNVDGQSLTMMLDTGASESVLCESRVKGRIQGLKMRSVEKMNHLQGGNFVRKVELQKTVLGSEETGRIPAVLANLPGLDALQLDGILALRALKHNQVHFNLQAGQFSWGD